MYQRNLKILATFVLLLFLVLGCAHINYVGKSYDPTDHIDVYYAPEDITREYTVMGHAIGGGQLLVSTSKIQNKLIEKAKSKGADAVLITGIGRQITEENEGFDAEKQVKATFLKYK
jgi:hypothetical protein